MDWLYGMFGHVGSSYLEHARAKQRNVFQRCIGEPVGEHLGGGTRLDECAMVSNTQK